MKTVSSLPPSDSPTVSSPLSGWLAAACLSLVLGGALLWALIGSSLFSEWEIARLSQSGEITLAEPLPLARTIHHYLNSGEPGLIQHHRLNNPERTHLRSVRQLLQRLKFAVQVFAVLGLLIFSRLAWQVSFRPALHSTLRRGALLSFSLAVLTGVALLTSGFAGLFVQFHYLLFAQPDWVFPADATLTALYPPQLFLHGIITWLILMAMAALFLALAAGVSYRFTSSRPTLQ